MTISSGDSTASSMSKLALASKVSSKVQIQSIYQQSASFVRMKELDSQPDTLINSHECVTCHDIDKKVITATVSFRVVANTADGRAYITIESEFVASYTAESLDDVSKEHIDVFGEINGTYNLWPYWREFVQTATVRMDLPALVLPVYRPVLSPEETKPDKQKSAKRSIAKKR